MRTTVTLDDKLELRLRKFAGEHNLRFKTAINEILSKGLDFLERPQSRKIYKGNPKKVGLREGLSYDNVSELLELVEGPLYK